MPILLLLLLFCYLFYGIADDNLHLILQNRGYYHRVAWLGVDYGAADRGGRIHKTNSASE
jgi:hypothetical protein